VKRWSCFCYVIGVLFSSLCVHAQIAPGSIDFHWNEGAKDCKTNPPAPLEVHPYNDTTYILRENLCATSEAPFIYLLIGSSKALLIDTGDVPEPEHMPLAETVMRLLPVFPVNGASKIGLIVVHSHRHLDHRAGDGQFQNLPNVQLVGWDIDSVRKYYGFTDWPNGIAQLDLGNRIVDVLPTPGHNATHVAFYDRNTALFFSGDFFLPGRLFIEDFSAGLSSAKRVASFIEARPVSHVLGGHIEINQAGNTYDWGSQYHPQEHVLQLTKKDLTDLPETISHFNGFYNTYGGFTMLNQERVLIADVAALVLTLAAAGYGLFLYLRRRKRRRTVAQPR